MGFIVYTISFYRQYWGLPTEFVGVIWSAHTATYVIGSLLCGRVVSRVGRKRLTGLSLLFIGVLMVVYSNAPNYYVSIISSLSLTIFMSFWTTSSNDLALAQVPEYSGAMMSLNSGSNRLGGALGSAVGGLILTFGGYSLLGIVLGIAGITAFIVITLFVKDPAHLAPAEPLNN